MTNDAWIVESAEESARKSEALPGGIFVFADGQILPLLSVAGISRLKGVFRLEHDEWAAVNRTTSGVTVTPTAYRRDSRVEAFGNEDWGKFEERLLGCLIR